MENQQAELQKLEGVVERVIYENAETGYTVWRAEPRLRFDSGVNP